MGTDSAGVHIVETAAPAGKVATAWSVQDEPALQIGKRAGESSEVLYEVGDVSTLHSGRLAIANEGSAQVLLYNAGGEFLRAIGRAGDGPGEFHAPRRVYALPRDRLLVYDPPARSFSIFTQEGGFVRRFRRPLPEGVSGRLTSLFGGVFADGSLLIGGAVQGGGQPPIRVYGRTILPVRSRVYRVALDGQIAAELGEFITRATQTRDGSFAFGPVGYIAASGNAFHYGPGFRYEIRSHGIDGRLRRIVRHTAVERPVTEEIIAEITERRLENGKGMPPSDHDQYLQRLGVQHFPPVLPAHGPIQAGKSGIVWVQRWELNAADARIWDVFGADGSHEGIVELPGRFTLMEIGEGYILGVSKDELGVEYVVRHDLKRPLDVGG